MCSAIVVSLNVIFLSATGVAIGLGRLDRVLRTGAVRGAPCRFLYDLIHLRFGSAGV